MKKTFEIEYVLQKHDSNFMRRNTAKVQVATKFFNFVLKDENIGKQFKVRVRRSKVPDIRGELETLEMIVEN